MGAPGDGDECSAHFWRGGLIELPDGNWASPYTGNSKLHNVTGDMVDAMFPAHRPLQIRWARWQPHRFCGLVAALEGRFTIPTVYRCHDELRLNYRCQPGGWIKVEILGRHSLDDPGWGCCPGFSFAECDLLTGDAIDHVVTWKGQRDISGIGETVAIRIRCSKRSSSPIGFEEVGLLVHWCITSTAKTQRKRGKRGDEENKIRFVYGFIDVFSPGGGSL